MKIIVAVDKNWGIGKNNDLQVRNDDDLERFKKLTKNNIVVYGSNTLKTFPGSKPLKNRINILLDDKANNKTDILSNENETEALYIVNNFFDALDMINSLEKKYRDKEVYIIGGGSVYSQFLPYASEAIVTKWDFEKEADTFFDNLSENTNWEIYKEENVISEGGNFIITTYINNNIKKSYEE